MQVRHIVMIAALFALAGCADACGDDTGGTDNNGTATNNDDPTNNPAGTNNDTTGGELQVDTLESGGFGVVLRSNPDRDGLQAVVLDFGTGEVHYETPTEYVLSGAQIASDGSRMVFAGRAEGEQMDTFVVDLPDGSPEPLGLPGDDPNVFLSLLWGMSADGTRVIYSCSGSAGGDSVEGLCKWEAGSGVSLAGPEDFNPDRAALSDDGQTIVAEVGSALHRLDFDGEMLTEVYDFDNPPGPDFPDEAGSGMIRVSADGAVVAVSGNDTDGDQRSIAVVGDGVEEAITFPFGSPEAGVGLDVSPDGARVVFNDYGTLAWVEVADVANENVIGEGEVFDAPVWASSDAIGHYVVDTDTRAWEVRYTEIDGEPQTIASGAEGSVDIIGDIFDMRQ